MTRITPVKLASSSKALWFDSNGLETLKGHAVVVQTARGIEFGQVAEVPFEATEEQLNSLKSALKPVLRIATQEDVDQAAELEQKGRDAMPDFRRLVEEAGLEMRPISVEYLFEGDKAVFYFEADDRVDFRELVRQLASCFHVRVDMRQIGVRDEARMVGGIGHCGQELCCARMGGEFCPVSIRMAKEQDLSLNPQKISGLCGRLMCCLRYEYDAYKDFKGRAPKVGAVIHTPVGNAKVVSLDVPQEIVTLQVEDDKKIKVPLADMERSDDKAQRPDLVNQEAWDRATTADEMSVFVGTSYESSQFTASNTLGGSSAIHRDSTQKPASEKNSTTRSSRSAVKKNQKEEVLPARKTRRRSTKLSLAEDSALDSSNQTNARTAATEEPTRKSATHTSKADEASTSHRRRRRSRSDSKKEETNSQGNGSMERKKSQGKARASENTQEKSSIRPGHKSSGLRHTDTSLSDSGQSGRQKTSKESSSSADDARNNGAQKQGNGRRRRRRSGSSDAQKRTQDGE